MAGWREERAVVEVEEVPRAAAAAKVVGAAELEVLQRVGVVEDRRHGRAAPPHRPPNPEFIRKPRTKSGSQAQVQNRLVG